MTVNGQHSKLLLGLRSKVAELSLGPVFFLSCLLNVRAEDKILELIAEEVTERWRKINCEGLH
jgi:hypothetical protein